MKTLKVTLILMLCGLQFSFARPKPTHFAKRTCHMDCGLCEIWMESVGDPCLKKWYCVTANGSTREMKCDSWQWSVLPNDGGASDLEANDVGAIYLNENIIVAIDENSDDDDIVFRAYLNNNLDESIIATAFHLPNAWVQSGWGYNIAYASTTNQLLIKVYPLVYTNDSLFCNSQNINGGYNASISVSYLENALFGANQITGKINGIPVFSSDEIIVKIFPNPVKKDAIQIKLDIPYAKSMGHIVTITDINGKIVSRNSFATLENKLNISDLENGIYLIKVEVGNALIKQEKLLVQR